ncbi:recombination regulator RecX [Bacillus massiliglaciei]|uniref:recombination regulator RecX n=1 Tax=Bacillus massiliglaciei TaxID=1816693 RepID=UPI002D21987C|nr:recombination regulator RecX [Bacillus massiliglaciei]
MISKVTVQKKRSDRYNIFIDDQYAFSVDEEILLKYELKKGKEVDSLLLSQIQYVDEIQKAFNDALNYLSFRMRSESEVRKHLKQKGIEDPVIKEAIHKLYQYNYLNDLDFAKAFVQTKANNGAKGPITTRLELKEKGVSEALIDQAMDEYPFELQLEHAIKLAEKAIQKEKKLSERALEQKINQTLARKGFSSQVIQEVLMEVSLEKEQDEQWEALCYQAEKASRRYSGYEGFEYEQKMKQALFRKGFPIELIDRYLDADKEE